MHARVNFRHFFSRLALEMGPLLVFFVTTQLEGIVWGTAAFMAATAVAFVLSWRREHRLPVMPLVGTAFTIVFGGLTLATHDPTFIMVRPTVFNTLAALILVGLMARNRLVLADIFGAGVPLEPAAWRVLTWRLAAFFLVLAAINELTWRFTPLTVWISVKTFVLPPLNALFLAANWPFVRRSLQRAES